MKFAKEPIKYSDRMCIIVIDIQTLSVGFIVDNVAEVLAIPVTIGAFQGTKR